MKHFLVATLALVLAACGSKGDDEAAATSTSAPRTAGDDSVLAVLESQGTALAQLRFLIGTRPEVGKPFGVQLIASTSAPIPRLVMVVESEGLAVDAAGVPVELALTEAGSGSGRHYSASHDLTAMARGAGLAEIMVRMGASSDSLDMLYVIPVLVARAEPAPEAAAGDPGPAAEAGGGGP